MIAPAFKKLAKEMKDRAVFAKVNVAMARDVASRMRVSSMPTFHFYEDGIKRHEFSGAGEYQLRQLAERVANDAAAKNVKLSSEALRAFYDEHDSGKDIAPIIKKCASLAKSRDCVGGAARELAKKLKAKFGSAPSLTKRFGEAEPPKPKPKRTSRSLDQASTDELLAELAKRSDDDDLAFAATEAAEKARRELEEDEEDEADLYPTIEASARPQ
jgi:thioredoxin-like negative regulator of GroEL